MTGGLSTEELVRLRAYALWIEDGQPEGREQEHWQRARREIERSLSVPEREIDEHLYPNGAGGAGERA